MSLTGFGWIVLPAGMTIPIVKGKGELMMLRFLLLVLLLMAPVAAGAHSPLVSVTPADGSELQAAPDTIILHFASPTKMVKFTLVTADGAGVDLDDSFLMHEDVSHSIPLPALATGRYQAGWRVLGEDGHLLKGKFSFTISEN